MSRTRIVRGKITEIVGGDLTYFSESIDGGNVSLMRFLQDNKESYPLLDSANLFNLEFKNSFGI